MPKEWTKADEVEAIAARLIEILKPELEGFEIRYIFSSENPKKDGREVSALARKVTGLNAYLAGCAEGFFVMEVGLPAWEMMTAGQKIALVHHELCHFGINEDTGNLWIIPHDIEEFTEIAKVHGSYHDGLIFFSEALEIGNSDVSGRAELIKSILDRNG